MESGVTQTRNDARFGKYTLVAKLATGGMGEIFLAKLSGMAGFEKLVVIKRLLPHLAEDSHFVTMLLDEARIAARLSHPNVCQVHDLGEVEGQYYIAMEYLEGVPCSQLLKRARRHEEHLDAALACSILQQTCEGLHHAHELVDNTGRPIELVHRDVSPSNLFATVSGVIKVLDFGVAKSQDARARTHTGALKGKYAYMSPEQVMAHELDRRSDIFSMGIVFFELLTTRRLFWRDSEYKMFQAIAEEPIPDVRDYRPDVPAPLAAIVRKALSRDRDKRFATAVQLSTAIGKVTAAMGETAGQRTISEYVTRNFERSISERRELLKTAVSSHEQPTVADGRADMGEHSRAVSEARPFPENPTPSNLSAVLDELKPGDLAPEKKSSKIPLIAVLALLLVGAGVVAAGYMRGEGDGGDRSPVATRAPVSGDGDTASSERAATDGPGDGDTDTGAGGVETDSAGAGAGDGADPWVSAPADDANKSGDGEVPTEGGGALFAAINRAGGAACTRLATEKQPAFKIELEINAAGRATGVDVSPRSMRRDKLARCLGRAARKARFKRNKKGAYKGEVKIRLKTTD